MRHRGHNKVCQGYSERERETPSKRKIVWFLHDGSEKSDLCAIIEEVMVSRLWNRVIDLVLSVAYLKPSDS
jgi:hypothetical protein